jgi:hypothetical protein
MAKSLQAVIELSADPSGVVKGVQAASRELTKLNRAAGVDSMLSGVMGIVDEFSRIASMFEQAAQAIDSHFAPYRAAAQAYSPEAQRAGFAADRAKMESERSIGQAFGPYEAEIKRLEAERIRSKAAEDLKNMDATGFGALLWANVKDSWSAASNEQSNMNEGYRNLMNGDVVSGLGQMGMGFFTDYWSSTGATDMSAGWLERIANAIEGVDRKIGGQ